MKEQLPALGQSMKLAIIDDGHASVYFQEELPKMEMLLASVQQQWPQNLSFSHPIKCTGPMPDAPKVTTSKHRRNFKVNREASTKAGVSLSDISQALKELPEPVENTESTSVLDGKFVSSNHGDKIPLDQLVDSEIIQVTRPLIVEQP